MADPYPPTEPYDHGMLDVGDDNLVYWETRGNSDFAGACTRYSDLLVDRSTFSSVTLEELLDADALPPQTAAALGDRYVLR